MVANRTRRLSARNISVVVLVLVVIYALVGFLGLPWWLERALPERLEQHLGWQAQIEEIRVNPFAMSIEVLNLDAEDGNGEQVAAFDRLYANLGIWRLVTGIVALENIELEETYIRLDLLEDYSVNFARDWQANNPPSGDSTTDESAAGEPVRLYFDRVRVSGGELLFRDFSQQGQEEFRVTPLDLALNDLATWPREEADSNYYLLAAVGSQTIEWEGDLSISPLYSKGFIKLGGVTHTTLQHFLKPFLPYELRNGSVALSSEYELQSADRLFLSTSNGKLTVENLDLGLMDDGDEMLTTDNIRVDDIRFGLNSRELATGTVRIDGVALSLHRGPDGMINLLEPFQSGDDEEPAEESADSDMPLRWSVAGVELDNSSVNWRDEQVQAGADLSLTDLALQVDRLSHQLEEPVNYKAEASLGDGGRLVFNGQATIAPFTLDAGITASDIALAQFGPYVREAANLDVRNGRLSVDGNLDLDQQQDPLTGTFSGTGEVVSLDLRLGDSDESLIGWQNLRLEPVEYNVAPARLEIGTITLAGPMVNVIREEDGVHNLERIVRSTSAQEADGEASAGSDQPSAEESEPEFIFRIGQLMLEEGVISYADRTLDPTFSTRFDQLRGSVTGLSNIAPQQGKVTIQGRVGEVASMTLDGSVGTLGKEDTSELKLTMENLSLPMLSPYFGRYLGYGVDSGKLNLDLDYSFTGTSIDAGNSVIMDRLELGEPVPSDDAVSAPVKLGLALLRDRNGVIDIDLPISGDLESPDFSIGQVVMNAFVNLVAKAATSPFSMLGSIVDMAGLSGEDLGSISFEPGRVELAEGESAKLEALGKALNDRPALVLNIRGAVSPEADSSGLRQKRLFDQLGIAEADPASTRIARLEQAYASSDYLASVEEFRSDAAGSDGEISQSEWAQALVERLVTDIDLPPEALGNLASARGTWLRQQMLEKYEVPDSQLFLLDPVRDASADENGKVTVGFELDAR
ncbi:DUF748 domain-containing protein [Marinobacter sp. TBZ242]|uniref:DUF748 domain-containing protein n=1 Tax=Marinobacter azerbaijanicus TaxID=3050455 RepID=A0ABT7IGC7_9GAMM|nr:DUF748 domain-containing protein [Marinobacter sp. TBZ242]MDL0432807.1 DUF748 domain-containing protein [Marinobacter sp. TBZ242]